MSLEGKVAIVTGAKRGLGKAFARGLAEAGADVVVATRVTEGGKLDEIADAVRKIGRRALAVQCDVSKEEDAANLINATMAEFGKIDILVNNAGVTAQDSFMEIPSRRWNLIMNVNINGTFLCAQKALEVMLEQGSGTVINLSSILAERVQFSVPYGATKAAVERLTRGLAREMRKNPGIAITCLRPFFVKTEVVTGYLPDADMSDWETLEMWQAYIAKVAAADPQSITGKILDRAILEEMFGKVEG